MIEHVAVATLPVRLAAALAAAVGALALGLAIVGLCAIVSFLVAERTHEIGLRMALGADPGDVLRLVLGYGVKLAGIGLAVGVPVALAASRLLGHLLDGVSAVDPAVFLAVPVTVLAVSLAACYVPARRAMRWTLWGHCDVYRRGVRFNTEIWLPRPRDEVFQFFSDAANLETLTPPWLNFEILTPAIVLRPGVRIDYRLRLYGIPLRWQSEISRWEPPDRFVDQQRRGPYRSWVHTHRFVDERGGTRVIDTVDFEVPFGWLVGWLVMRDVRRIFAFRTATLLSLFGDTSGRTAHTEDEIRAHTIGDLKPLSSPIEIADYDPRWPELFAREAATIRRALSSSALLVEHVGSTSVPGLAAKPILDVLLVVADSAHEAAYVPALEAAGYTLRIREREWYEHRMLVGSVEGRTVHLHVFSAGCAESSRMLRFREWLRISDVDRSLYERTKRELAQQEWRYMQNYADAKTRVVEEIMARATRSA